MDSRREVNRATGLLSVQSHKHGSDLLDSRFHASAHFFCAGVEDILKVLDGAKFLNRMRCLRHTEQAMFGSGCRLPCAVDLDAC